MSTVTESDVKELKDLILAVRGDIKGVGDRITSLETKVTSLETKVTSLETRMTTLEAQNTTLESRFTAFEIVQAEVKGKLSNIEIASQKIPDLAEKVGELKNWKQIGLTLVGAFIGGMITYLAKKP